MDEGENPLDFSPSSALTFLEITFVLALIELMPVAGPLSQSSIWVICTSCTIICTVIQQQYPVKLKEV